MWLPMELYSNHTPYSVRFFVKKHTQEEASQCIAISNFFHLIFIHGDMFQMSASYVAICLMYNLLVVVVFKYKLVNLVFCT